MVDLTVLKPHIIEDDSHTSGYAVSVVSRIGFEEYFNNQLEIFCNCTRTFKDGRRCTQTNDKRYSREITDCVRMIEQFAENKDEAYLRLLDRHNKNLEYEAINGFEYDPVSNKNKKKQSAPAKKRSKQTSLKLDNGEKKETVAEKKLKAHAMKMSALMFKPKEVDNGNSL